MLSAPQEFTGGAGKPPGWPRIGTGSRAAALKLIGGVEKRCGQGAPVISAVTFAEDRIGLRLSSGRELWFTGLSPLERDVAACTGAPGVASDPAPDPQEQRIWEQWRELLLDVSGYPTSFQDLHPGLEVITVRRRHRQARITVGDGTTRETYRVALDEDVQYPAGIADDIRYSFRNDAGPSAPFAKKSPDGP